MGGDVGLLCPVAQGYDRQDGLVFRDVEYLPEFIGITHTHNEGVEPHCTGLEDKVGVAEAVVVCTPEVSGGIYRLAAEKAGLSCLESGYKKHGSVDYPLLVAAYQFKHSGTLFLTYGYIVLAGLLVGPGRSVL